MLTILTSFDFIFILGLGMLRYYSEENRLPVILNEFLQDYDGETAVVTFLAWICLVAAGECSSVHELLALFVLYYAFFEDKVMVVRVAISM